MRPRFEAIVALTDAVCHAHLDGEYARLAREAAARLARKRPSPLASGQPKSWACGIVYALGRVNFLSDAGFEPHMRLEDLCRLFGASPATGSAKAATVRDALGMRMMDPRWTIASRMDQNPLAWMLMIDGLLVDARVLPHPVQEQLAAEGFIPYVPGEEGPAEG